MVNRSEGESIMHLVCTWSEGGARKKRQRGDERGCVEFRLPVRRLSWSASDDHVVGLCGVKTVCVYACGRARGLQGVRLS
jgi:hypothetical protein